jgi:hypothetical protein
MMANRSATQILNCQLQTTLIYVFFFLHTESGDGTQDLAHAKNMFYC